MWTLRSSVRFAAAPAPPKPRHGDRAGGAGSRSALGARKLTTVPLQSEWIASHFSTISLRRSATFDRRIKADGTTAAVLARVRRGAIFAPARCARVCSIGAVSLAIAPVPSNVSGAYTSSRTGSGSSSSPTTRSSPTSCATWSGFMSIRRPMPSSSRSTKSRRSITRHRKGILLRREL